MQNDNLNSKVDISALPFSQACENNKQPILEVLQNELQGFSHVLEIGSGTGQHSVYFAPNLTHLQWQTSDVVANHSTIEAWHSAYPSLNLHTPLPLTWYMIRYRLMPLPMNHMTLCLPQTLCILLVGLWLKGYLHWPVMRYLLMEN